VIFPVEFVRLYETRTAITHELRDCLVADELAHRDPHLWSDLFGPLALPPTGLGCQSAETRSGRHALGTVGDCAPRNLLVAQCRGLKVAFQSLSQEMVRPDPHPTKSVMARRDTPTERAAPQTVTAIRWRVPRGERADGFDAESGRSGPPVRIVVFLSRLAIGAADGKDLGVRLALEVRSGPC
jgi:hypothetical protein